MKQGAASVFLTGVLLAVIGPAQAATPPAVVGAASQGERVNAAQPEAPRHWAADTSNGCKVWSPEPIGGEITVRWSGPCENDLAQGPGTVRWLNNTKQVAELTGTMVRGKLRGHTTGVEEPGNRFDGMFIESLPEGEGKASFADGSIYNGEWHRGRQFGYGIMTFPPAHPQYQEMLRDGKGRRAENGAYVLRGWWEGKTFIIPCDSEEECEKAVVAMTTREQAAAAAKAGTPATPPPPTTPAATAAPAVEPAAAPAQPMPATPTPTVEPAAVTPVPVSPAMEPLMPPVSPAPATPAAPVTEPVPPPGAPDVEPAAVPAATAPAPEQPAMPQVLPEPAATAPVVAEPVSAPGAADVGPAAMPAATAPASEPPAMEPAAAPPTPVADPASDPAVPAVPEAKPAVEPETATPATSDAGLGARLITNGFS
ncbi:hypothetical protein BCF11_2627 [Collimonas sp. PA-H2]|uniref:hypothetical protein n=1 Tax=Collimonas sp. PA-H2 TaxID=1881062 RepID=UPI000BF45FC7|nr:hypothetical protein [Collimonas sp. PA-H2]PFH10210.1 hypothetical protein BCF11_2627 [Collimonas sp. PA-H2]